MAISQVAAYAHLSRRRTSRHSDANLTPSAARSKTRSVSKDAAYIRRTILLQRTLDVAARLVIHRNRYKTGWLLGTIALAAAKSIENMEIGHNVGHGQWDWMNDPEIHSSTWEWDMAGLSSQWRYSHNYTHHVYNNILGMDDDIGFGVMRVTRDQPWKPEHLLSATSKPLAGRDIRMGHRPARLALQPGPGIGGRSRKAEGRPCAARSPGR